jgi:hypothetical protein
MSKRCIKCGCEVSLGETYTTRGDLNSRGKHCQSCSGISRQTIAERTNHIADILVMERESGRDASNTAWIWSIALCVITATGIREQSSGDTIFGLFIIGVPLGWFLMRHIIFQLFPRLDWSDGTRRENIWKDERKYGNH